MPLLEALELISQMPQRRTPKLSADTELVLQMGDWPADALGPSSAHLRVALRLWRQNGMFTTETVATKPTAVNTGL